MKYFLSLSLFLALCPQLFSQTDKEQILSEMDRQMKCWNEGDIDCFMEGYWKSDSLMFISKNGINYGWDNTYQRYLNTYPDRQTMGQLEFEIKELKPIENSGAYFMVGGWKLIREMGNIGGHFTLLWKKIDNKWVIVADHTS